MGLKGLFVGVYASNAVIKAVFLPLLYLLLSSPFIAILINYINFDFGSLNPWKNTSTADICLQIFVTAVAFLLPTRILSGKSLVKVQDGTRRVQQAPYWIPMLRHWGDLVLRGDRWLKGIRDSSVLPIVAYNAAGTKHNIILSPQLLEQVLKQRENLEEAEISNWTPLKNAYGISGSAKSWYLSTRSEVVKTAESQIFKGAGMEQLFSTSLRLFTESLPDLITFNTSIVDQLPWERVAGIELTDGTDEAECELFTLVNEFFCNAFITPLTGPQFPESYQLLASDLWAFNRFYYAIASSLPRLFPIPGLPGAVLAQKRLLQNFDRLFRELTNPPKKRVPEDDESVSGEETDADAPTPFTKLNDIFTKENVPNAARTAIALELLHSIFSEIVPIACWTILHIHKSSSSTETNTLIDTIRKETKIWVEGTQPPSIHPSFPAPPEISFMGTARPLSPTSFPHLRSCINEARRLYKASAHTFNVTKPITLTEPISIRPGVQEKWELDVGSCVDVGMSEYLTNTSSANFLSPNEYKPDRFVENAPPASVTSPDDPKEPFATALLISLVAGILQLWDITPAPKKTIADHWNEAAAAASGEDENAARQKRAEAEAETGEKKEKRVGTWVIPKAVDACAVKVPNKEIRIRIRRLEGLLEKRTLRKGR